MANKWGKHSKAEYDTLDPRLQKVADKVLEFWDCVMQQGRRTEAEHQLNLAKGTSHTKNSKHVTGDKPSRAMDLAPFPVDWKDTERFYAFAGCVIMCGYMMGIKLRWGGDWDSDRDLHDQNFFDLVHFELVD